jgi:hypothetical protein
MWLCAAFATGAQPEAKKTAKPVTGTITKVTPAAADDDATLGTVTIRAASGKSAEPTQEITYTVTAKCKLEKADVKSAKRLDEAVIASARFSDLKVGGVIVVTPLRDRPDRADAVLVLASKKSKATE